MMRITDVRVRKVEKEGKMRAVVSITIDDEFVVHDIKVIEGVKGLFIAMPSRKAADGEFRDIAHPINSETRERIQSIILDEYRKEMTAEEDVLLRTLEARVTQLTLEYKVQKERNTALIRAMEEKDSIIAALNARIGRLQSDYANLKTARMIDISSEDMKNAKSRISKLVREVDKCIALLNV